jgi:hypothetical protein
MNHDGNWLETDCIVGWRKEYENTAASVRKHR